MFRRIREWLGLTSFDTQIQDAVCLANMRIAVVACPAILILQVLLIASVTPAIKQFDATYGASQGLPSMAWVSPVSYALVGLAAILLMGCAIAYLRQSSLSTRLAIGCTAGYAILCTTAGILLSIADARDQSGIFLLLTFLVASLCIYTYHPVFSVPLMVGSVGLLDVADNLIRGNAQHPSLVANVLWVCILFTIIFRFNAERLHAKAELQARRAAYFDFLTGLNNRSALRDNIAKLEPNTPYLVAIMDIDDFKYFNDVFGHDAGDTVLREYSRALIYGFGQEASYRYGGDEFIVITSELSEAEFLSRIKRFRKQIQGVLVGDSPITVTTSIGYVCGTVGDWSSFQDDLRLADQRLFYAKRQGKNRTVGPATPTYAHTIKSVRKDGHPLDPSISRLHKIDDIDPLTGLCNISAFLRRSQILLDDEERVAYGIYIAYMDLEGFSSYNERYGFEAGDKLLREVGDLLSATLPNHLIAYMGDDHFATAVYHDVLPEVVDQLRQEVRRLGGGVSIDLKIGICQPRPGEHLSSSIACDRARVACESIKGRHDKTTRVYDAELQSEVERRRYIVDNFEGALANGEIKLYLQPIMRSINGKVRAMEALSRWESPDYGLLSPVAYIDILEDSRLIHLLDLYMIEQVTKRMRDLIDKNEQVLPVSINLSRRDFEVCDMPEKIEQIMQRYEVPRDMLCIEITESALSEGGESLIHVVARLRSMGYTVWMDDFGSGYSSLNNLKDLDFDLIKIDMAFLRGLSARPASKVIIASIVDMAKKLGIRTLIEGVETVEQLEFIRNIGCELAQGFLFSKPLEDDEMRRQILEGAMDVELVDEHAYYDAIGNVNTLSPTPLVLSDDKPFALEDLDSVTLALVELRGNILGCTAFSGSFATLMEEMGLRKLIDYGLAAEDSSRAGSLHTLVRAARSSSAVEAVDFLINNVRYQIQARHVASMPQADTFVLTANSAHATLFPDATPSESTFLSDLLFSYDQVDVFDIQTGQAQNLCRGNADYPYGYEGDDVEAMARKYVEDNVHPEDREGFIAFEDISTAMDRLQQTNASFLTAAFRIRSLRDGSWRWKTFVLVPATFDGRPCLMSAVHDADLVSARRIVASE